MRRLTILLVAIAPLAPLASPQAASTFIRENYSKFEYRVPMRDGVKLFTSVYVPKDVFSDNKTYPIMFDRTPYSVGPYGADKFRETLGPNEFFAPEKFIFAYQDVRGRYMSEGQFVNIRPHNPKKGPRDTDESTDTYDTIEWMIHNIPGAIPKVGMWGISQPGFYVSAGMIDAHPALVAASPQAPVTDYYLGDDNFHNGAFMLAANFRFYLGFFPRDGEPSPPAQNPPFDFGTPDGYEFFLNMGSLANADGKYFKHKNPFWLQNIDHPTYDDLWESRSIWKHLRNISPSVMTVGGWFDAEDLQGPLRTHDFIEKNGPPPLNMLVMGPWTHGGFSRGDGENVGNVHFGSKTGLFYREKIEFPFFTQLLKGKPYAAFPKAWIFETGTNQWRRFDAWPPKNAQSKTIFLDAKGKLTWQQPGLINGNAPFNEYLSDPDRPVPYVPVLATGMRGDYMTEDQRFASTRPDVLVYKTEPLDHDTSIYGPISIDLKVSTTGTDSDFVVKVIDVYPGNLPETMGGYQQLVRGEPFRGKYRKSFSQPVPFEPGKPDRITFKLPDVAHTFRAGHRIMVQIQSSWFPLTDRNPQKFVDIGKASSADFTKATQRVYIGGADGSKIQLLVVE